MSCATCSPGAGAWATTRGAMRSSRPRWWIKRLVKAKQVLEEALGEPIILYCSPGDNTNMADHVLEACRRYDYLGAMSLTDALNLPG